MKKVPNLRFKEFSGEWESKKIGSICEIIMGQSPSSACYNEDKIGLPLIQGNADVKNRKTFPRVYTSDITKTCDVGDIIMSVRAPVGAISKSLHHACIGRGVCSIKPKQNSEFIYQFLLNYENKWSRISQGSTFESINSSDITSTNVVLPLREEQEKIASFFSLIDKKIELQTEKVEELKNYKKGLLQKIFSQELRFKDENGNEYPEWEEVNLRKILKEVSEKTTVINQYEVISSTNNGLYLQKDYFNREIASKDNIGYKILKRNQVVLSPQNLWMGNINLNSKYDIGMVSPSYKIFDIKSEFDSSYIGFILRTDRAFYEYKQASEQGASIVRRNLNMDLFYDVSFNLPCKAEQFKISKFINKIDCKIEQEVEKLESLNEYKKGLLQQMFI